MTGEARQLRNLDARTQHDRGHENAILRLSAPLDDMLTDYVSHADAIAAKMEQSWQMSLGQFERRWREPEEWLLADVAQAHSLLSEAARAMRLARLNGLSYCLEHEAAAASHSLSAVRRRMDHVILSASYEIRQQLIELCDVCASLAELCGDMAHGETQKQPQASTVHA